MKVFWFFPFFVRFVSKTNKTWFWFDFFVFFRGSFLKTAGWTTNIYLIKSKSKQTLIEKKEKIWFLCLWDSLGILSFHFLVFMANVKSLFPFTDSESESGSHKSIRGKQSGPSDGKPTRVRTVLNEKQLHTLRWEIFNLSLSLHWSEIPFWKWNFFFHLINNSLVNFLQNLLQCQSTSRCADEGAACRDDKLITKSYSSLVPEQAM